MLIKKERAITTFSGIKLMRYLSEHLVEASERGRNGGFSNVYFERTSLLRNRIGICFLSSVGVK